MVREVAASNHSRNYIGDFQLWNIYLSLCKGPQDFTSNNAQKTGLKYFGKTTSQDIKNYRGSGKYWIRHLNKHNVEPIHLWNSDWYYDTSISRFALKFSRLNKISTNNEWANLKEENGLDGGWDYVNIELKTNTEKDLKRKQKISKKVSDYHRSGNYVRPENFTFAGKKHSEETLAKMSLGNKGANNSSALSRKEIEKRIEDYNKIPKKRGYIKQLFEIWSLSHTQVRRFIQRHIESKMY